MAMPTDTTTLLCLFHHREQANAALQDLLKAGVPESSISVFDKGSANSNSLIELGVPGHDIDHLEEGLNDGGAIVSVAAISDHVDTVEAIFHDHSASKIDEARIGDGFAGTGAALAGGAAGAAVIPIVEEELLIGKRDVDRGGARVYRRIVEIPVEESVNLREEHVNVTRKAVDRPVTDADLALQGDHVIELTETAEEAVVGKSARVVEEVLVNKGVVEHTEVVSDTVRRTEVAVEEVLPGESRNRLA